jgi:hypothetical protein
LAVVVVTSALPLAALPEHALSIMVCVRVQFVISPARAFAFAKKGK